MLNHLLCCFGCLSSWLWPHDRCSFATEYSESFTDYSERMQVKRHLLVRCPLNTSASSDATSAVAADPLLRSFAPIWSAGFTDYSECSLLVVRTDVLLSCINRAKIASRYLCPTVWARRIKFILLYSPPLNASQMLITVNYVYSVT